MKNIFCITILFICASCREDQLYRVSNLHVPTEGPPEYQEGWQHGCQTGIRQKATENYRFSYDNIIYPAKMRNPIYRKAWQLGEKYCAHYMNNYLYIGTIDRNFGDGALGTATDRLRHTRNARDLQWFDTPEFEIFNGLNIQ